MVETGMATEIGNFKALKAASVFIASPDGSTGSGYLIAPGYIGTAWHVVASWNLDEEHEVLVGFGPTRRAVKVRLSPKVDKLADAAVLEIVGDLDAESLPVARALTRKAAWDGYGFPGVATKTNTPTGLPIDGHVQDAETFTDQGHPAVLLYSEQIAAGTASPLHGFSGSPVVVDGAVVGHLVKHIGEPDDSRRAAFGYVYACPIANVVALLDAPPVPRAITPAPLVSLRESVTADGALEEGEFHVFVSYRSTTDRSWAMALVARLEGAGLSVFIDQKELEPGQYLAQQLADGMKRSRAAVMLVSRGWLESPWCQQEQQVLTQRAVEDKKFTLVPLRLDASEMPTLLNARLWLDFSGAEHISGPTGPELDRLINTLLRRAAAPSQQAKADAAERAVSDEFVARVRSAAEGNPSSVEAIVSEWRRTRSDDTAPLIAAAEAYNSKALFEKTLALLDDAPRSLRVRQLSALAKRKLGHIDEARQELEALKREGNLDAETAGLLAGTYKARWLESGDEAFKLRAYETYREAYERSGDSFNGINAASMALHCGDIGKMHEFATQVINSLGKRSTEKLHYWEKATLGEAYLLKQRMDDARDWYQRAAAAAAGLHQDIAVMRRQARRNLLTLGLSRNAMDGMLPVPRVLAYTGHRIDSDGRSPPRFPMTKVAAVRRAIREKLQGLGALHGFGGAASGTDLLVLHELAERKLSATVVLPFPADDFVSISVGDGWWKRAFDELSSSGNPSIEFLDPLQDHVPHAGALPEAFRWANEEVQRRAWDYAKRLDEEDKVVVLVVWNGQHGDGPGGTADNVELWRCLGIEPIIIDPTTL